MDVGRPAGRGARFPHLSRESSWARARRSQEGRIGGPQVRDPGRICHAVIARATHARARPAGLRDARASRSGRRVDMEVHSMGQARKQAAVVPYRIRDRRLEVAVITIGQQSRLDRAKGRDRRRRVALGSGRERSRRRGRPAGCRRSHLAGALSLRERQRRRDRRVRPVRQPLSWTTGPKRASGSAAGCRAPRRSRACDWSFDRSSRRSNTCSAWCNLRPSSSLSTMRARIRGAEARSVSRRRAI